MIDYENKKLAYDLLNKKIPTVLVVSVTLCLAWGMKINQVQEEKNNLEDMLKEYQEEYLLPIATYEEEKEVFWETDTDVYYFYTTKDPYIASYYYTTDPELGLYLVWVTLGDEYVTTTKNEFYSLYPVKQLEYVNIEDLEKTLIDEKIEAKSRTRKKD